MVHEGEYDRRVDATPDLIDEQPVKHELSDYRRRRIGQVASKFIIGTYFALTPLQVLQTDIEINKMNLEESTPTVHSIIEAHSPENDDQATVFIDGFASQNGSWTTSKIADTLQIVNDSNIWALEFSKNGITIPAIAEQIAQKAEKEHVTSIALYGYSIGGMMSLEVAHELITKYNLNVSTIFLDHSPADRDSIRQSMRDQASPAIDTIQWFHSFGIDIEYSAIARDVINWLFAEDISHLGDTPISLMRSQYLYGVEAHTDRLIEQLGASTPRAKIVYITSKKPSTDYMVDVEQSETTYKELSTKNHLPFYVIPVDGAIHSRLDLTVDQYAAAFTVAAEELTAKEREATDITKVSLNGGYNAGAQQDNK